MVKFTPFFGEFSVLSLDICMQSCNHTVKIWNIPAELRNPQPLQPQPLETTDLFSVSVSLSVFSRMLLGLNQTVLSSLSPVFHLAHHFCAASVLLCVTVALSLS